MPLSEPLHLHTIASHPTIDLQHLAYIKGGCIGVLWQILHLI